MSNASDVAMWALGLSDACPALTTIQAALASAPPTYAKNGDVLYPGVTLVDADNGLVTIAEVDHVARFCTAPAGAALDPHGQGKATVEYNTAFAAGSDRGIGLWLRVLPVKAQDSAARAFVPDTKADWLPNAWSVGNEFADWPAVIQHLQATWHAPT